MDSLREAELEIKKAELANQSWQLYNEYIKELRGRIDGFVKSILLVSGGALTLSAGLFLRQDKPTIYAELIPTLKNSWASFGFSIALMFLLILLTLIFGYRHERRWAAMLEGRAQSVTQPPVIESVVLSVVGLIGVVSFFCGLWSMIYVARNML